MEIIKNPGIFLQRDGFAFAVFVADELNRCTLKVYLRGNVNITNVYIAYIISSVIDCVDYASAEIDARNMNLTNGNTINLASLEFLSVILKPIIRSEKDFRIVSMNDIAMDILENTQISCNAHYGWPLTQIIRESLPPRYSIAA